MIKLARIDVRFTVFLLKNDVLAASEDSIFKDAVFKLRSTLASHPDSYTIALSVLFSFQNDSGPEVSILAIKFLFDHHIVSYESLWVNFQFF